MEVNKSKVRCRDDPNMFGLGLEPLLSLVFLCLLLDMVHVASPAVAQCVILPNIKPIQVNAH